MDLKIYPSSLSGFVKVPASKSITHRHLICAALSYGKSVIHNPLICDDTLATIDVLKQLGAKFKFENNRIIVKGVKSPKIKDRQLTILESATTLRMLLPLLVLFSKTLTITSTKRLIDRIYTSDLFDLKGLEFQRKDYSITIRGQLIEKDIVLSGKITTQLISGVLVALPFLDGYSLTVKDISFSSPYVMLTLDAMKKFGINYQIENNKITIQENVKYTSKETLVEGDFSNGAIWLAASYFHKDLRISGLNIDSLQGDRKIIDYFHHLGVEFKIIDDIIKYQSGKLTGGTLDIEETPDLAPILVAIASKASGTVIIQGTSKLKYKESNRKLAIMEVVNTLGGYVKLNQEDNILINGKEVLHGGEEVSSYNDHRIVMAATILATISEYPVVIKDFQAINKSYPEFFSDLAEVGAKFEVV